MITKNRLNRFVLEFPYLLQICNADEISYISVSVISREVLGYTLFPTDEYFICLGNQTEIFQPETRIIDFFTKTSGKCDALVKKEKFEDGYKLTILKFRRDLLLEVMDEM